RMRAHAPRRTGGAMVTTIRDVARASGVSIATVSRALAGSTIVAAGTRERVRRAAEELGYQPNRAARQLVTRRGQSNALVLPVLRPGAARHAELLLFLGV